MGWKPLPVNAPLFNRLPYREKIVISRMAKML
jgi:hypothetical protein